MGELLVLEERPLVKDGHEAELDRNEWCWLAGGLLVLSCSF